MRIIPSPRDVQLAAENISDRVLRGKLADVTPLAQTTILESPQCHVVRFDDGDPTGHPVLFVPPLAAPTFVFDMRRGCSFAEYMTGAGHDVYLVDYGEISFAERHLGLEHWVEGVIPEAINAASASAGGRPMHLIGWSLGGALAALAIANEADLPVASLTVVGTPFDTTHVPMISFVRPFVEFTRGAVGTAVYRTLGTAPGPIVKRFYQVATFDKVITKPIAIAQNLADRDSLEQIEAVDRMMDSMTAFSGRALGQIYHDLVRLNDLADGHMTLAGKDIDISGLKQPVLAIGGSDDGIAPIDSVHHVAELIQKVQTETVPGGHLGMLAGRGARETTWPLVDRFIRQAARSGRRSAA